MNVPVASVQLDLMPDQPHEPFVLRVGDDQGSVPLQVQPLVVHSWTRKPGVYDALLPDALRMKAAGVQRIRLYCPIRSAVVARLLVHGGRQRYLGRRKEPLVETLTWTRNRSCSLHFCYDRPDVRILEQTQFMDNDGNVTTTPTYIPATGVFRHAQEVTGALVVEYRPGFSLYEIQYDTGEAQITAKAFRAMQLAWLAGNIRDAMIPLVRVIAISGKNATQLTFPRRFWPEHSAVRQWFQDEVVEPKLTPVAGGFRLNPGTILDPCWARCKEQVRPEDNYLTVADRQAILDCVEQGKHPRYHYVESTRTTKTERVYSQDDPEVYVDVARPVELIFRLQRADDSPCADHTPPNCCSELVLRFKSN